MKKKQVLSICLAAAMVCSMPLTAFAAEGEKETITFSFDRGVASAVDELVEKYNASQDKVVVEIADLPQNADQVHDDFATKLATGDDTVDLFALDKIWITEFSSAGWLLSRLAAAAG